MPLSGTRQVRIRGSVDPEFAGRLRGEIYLELRGADGTVLLRSPARVAWAQLEDSADPLGLVVQFDACLSLEEPESHARRVQRELAISQARVETDDRITEGMREARKRRQGQKPTCARNREMLALSDDGWSHARIGAVYGISAQRVCQILGELRGTRVMQGSQNPQRDGEIMRLSADGVLPVEIASRVGISRHLVSQILYRERKRRESQEGER